MSHSGRAPKALVALDQVDLGDVKPIIKRLCIGLGGQETSQKKSWLGPKPVDVDVSCFVLNRHAKVLDTVGYKHLRTRDDSIRYVSDSANQVDGDHPPNSEVIEIDLDQVDPQVNCLVFTVTSYRGHRLHRSNLISCQVVDQHQGLIATADLTIRSHKQTGIIVAMVKRHRSHWMLTAIDQPTQWSSPEQAAHHLESLLSYRY